MSAEFREHNTWRLTWVGLETGLFAWKELLGFCGSVFSSSERVPHHPGRRDSEGPEPVNEELELGESGQNLEKRPDTFFAGASA